MNVDNLSFPVLLQGQNPAPACRLSAISDRLQHYQPPSSSVLPSSMPPSASSVPTHTFAFHLPRLVNATFYFLPPSQEIALYSITLTEPPLPHFSLSPSHRELQHLPRNRNPFFFKLKTVLSHKGNFVICLLSIPSCMTRAKHLVSQAGDKNNTSKKE